jgi:hypothetical protein
MAITRDRIEAACAPHGLTLLGVTEARALIGMRPEAWEVFRASPEYDDGAPDPLDRWSMRLLPALAEELGAREVVYPFGGPPYAPFIRWAFDSGETFSSPVGMLVHHRAGFWISFRGALVFDAVDPTPSAASPCPACSAPCATACPVGALAPGKDYDVPACKAHVASPEGAACREGGCLVRRACPVSQAFGRDAAQSAFHMRAFTGA